MKHTKSPRFDDIRMRYQTGKPTQYHIAGITADNAENIRQLIATAPELLAALEKAYRDVCENKRYYPDQGDVNPHPFIKEIETIIAKAKGNIK